VNWCVFAKRVVADTSADYFDDYFPGREWIYSLPAFIFKSFTPADSLTAFIKKIIKKPGQMPEKYCKIAARAHLKY